ncbi:hypothetical protein HYY70_02735 [Candidatus Woesearchaeota archaeon]|nr:hypothetical protein [Candidatus Woesearchaeota archaeon]
MGLTRLSATFSFPKDYIEGLKKSPHFLLVTTAKSVDVLIKLDFASLNPTNFRGLEQRSCETHRCQRATVVGHAFLCEALASKEKVVLNW